MVRGLASDMGAQYPTWGKEPPIMGTLHLAPIGMINGKLIMPIMGGSGPAVTPPADPPAPPDPAPTPEPPAPPADPGFPANTPVAEMTPDQQAAYWKDKSQKHEQAWRKVIDKNLTPDQVLEMQQKLDEAERAKLSDHERAIEDAKAQAKAEVLAEAGSQTVQTLLEGTLKFRGLDQDKITNALKYINPTAFLKDGLADTDAVLAYAETIAGPVQGAGTPPDFGAGRRGMAPTLSAREQGLAEAQRRFGTPGAVK